MTSVSISELKAQLSRYLREVRRGGEVQVLDRGKPVARLTGIPAQTPSDDESRRDRLLRSGVLRPGSGDASEVLETQPLEVPASILEALEEERADRL